jgi:hypothetical protein
LSKSTATQRDLNELFTNPSGNRCTCFIKKPIKKSSARSGRNTKLPAKQKRKKHLKLIITSMLEDMWDYLPAENDWFPNLFIWSLIHPFHFPFLYLANCICVQQVLLSFVFNRIQITYPVRFFILQYNIARIDIQQ